LHKFEFSLIHVCAIDKFASRYLNYNVNLTLLLASPHHVNFILKSCELPLVSYMVIDRDQNSILTLKLRRKR